ncbi:MAG TPA: hypothetical protein EYQ24_04175 [Bacteroidetes bacterium]|nr:hypothetical protein [Bacteroidota bacterium]HIL57672.1 hypothetical protein [Rhodothermales bacterium]
MRPEERIGLRAFLDAYPGMRVCPSPAGVIRLEGDFGFRADHENGPVIEDSYRLQIEVPHRFPDELLTTFELGSRIPRDPDHHVLSDGSLCLGSPFRLLLIAREARTLTAFARQGIVPYLYAASYRERTGGPYPFGELAHGAEGLLDDYAQLFGLTTHRQALAALALLATKRRLANKKPCPCGCAQRLGVCRFNETIRSLRGEFGRTRFKRLYGQVLSNWPSSGFPAEDHPS